MSFDWFLLSCHVRFDSERASLYKCVCVCALAPYGPGAASTCVHRAGRLCVQLHVARTVGNTPRTPPPGTSCKRTMLHRAAYDDSGINKGVHPHSPPEAIRMFDSIVSCQGGVHKTFTVQGES